MDQKELYESLIKPNGQSLFDAIEQNNLNLFEQLVKDYKTKNKNFKLSQVTLAEEYSYFITPGSSLLYFAAAVGSTAIIEFLLKDEEIKKTISNKRIVLEWIPSVRPEYVETPLSAAIRHGNFEATKLLLLSGAKFDPDKYYNQCYEGDAGKQPNKISALIDLYKYRSDIDKELNSFFYKKVVSPLKAQIKANITFFKEPFPYEKSVKSQLANLLINIFEGKELASKLDELTPEQIAALQDGRLKTAYDQVIQQKLLEISANNSIFTAQNN